jgi:hypothetical protein
MVMPRKAIYAFVAALFFVSWPSAPSLAATMAEQVLPSPSCGQDWNMEEQPALYTKDTLFDRIDGEAEVYFPYGFEVLASARYVNMNTPQLAIEVDVYKMGSLLNAFGIYANYRRTDDAAVAIGAEGFLSASQLLFYQDRYFVKLQASGTTALEQSVFLACARAVSQKLPRNTRRPREVDAFKVPSVVPQSERYIAKSLLGYAFFERGLIADAVLEGERVQVFFVPGESRDAARKTFEKLRSHLKTSGQDLKVTENGDRVSLTATDPLYQKMLVEQSDRYIVGVVRIKSIPAATQLMEQVRKRLPW